jgi:glycosyltransferase involved in cell wall biosynthesis
MAPLKILYFNPVGTIGGAEMCLLDVLATVGAARPDWRLGVVLGDDGPLRRAVADLGLACALLPLPGGLARMGDSGGKAVGSRWSRGGVLVARGSAATLATAAYGSRLRRLIRAEAPDLIQTNGMKAHVLGAWAAPRHVPVVWHLHDYLGSRPVMARLLRNSARRRVEAVAVSRSVADDAERTLGARVPIRTISNAVDLERFAPEHDHDHEDEDGAWLDEAAGMPPAPPGTVRVGLVATFAVWKGHDVFLDAIARIPADPCCRYYIIGGPIYRSRGSQVALEDLRQQAEALGLGGRLGFAGHQADPARAIRALDVVVHASTRPEPFGRVIVEGMASGRAVVAIEDGGAAELFEDERTALGCPPRDPDRLARAISRLVGDPELRRRLGRAGREAARVRFDRRRLVEPWISLYESIGRDGRPEGADAPGQGNRARGNERSEV